MQADTYVTSQGEIVHKDAPVKDEVAHGGVLNGLWDTVKGTVIAAEHMAEMAVTIAGEAAHNAKEATSELIEKGMEKAHEASDMIVEQTKELVSNLPTTEETKEKGSEALGKVMHAGIQLQEFAELIIEQSREMSMADLEQGAKKVATQVQHVAEQVAEKGTEVVQAVMHAAEGLPEQGAQLAEAAKEKLPEQAQDKLEQVMDTAAQVKDVVVEQAKAVISQASEVVEQVVPAVQQQLPRVNSLKRVNSKQMANVEPTWNQQTLTLTMDVVSHLQRIADRTGDAILHETARKAHSACAKGLSEAPGVHLTWVTPQQANDLVNLAIRTQDHELADFARYCQSVAATSHIAVEPTPGKIQQEILKGHQELQQQGRIHTGPGYGAAFASVNRSYNLVDPEGPIAPPSSPVSEMADSQAQKQPTLAPTKAQPMVKQPSMSNASVTAPSLVLSMDVVSHIQRIADRTGNELLHDTARKAHSAFAKGLSEAPGVHLTWITPQQASELMNLASRTGDKEVVDFARYCQSVAATTQVGVEPAPGKIQEEILKGRMELQKLQSEQPQQQQPVLQSQPLSHQSPVFEPKQELQQQPILSVVGRAAF